MQDYHEPHEKLSKETKDYIRALTSMKEEIEAVDWYQQRMDATKDKQLKKILKHNRDEEMEHAAMTLEWLRRQLPELGEELKSYLFTPGSITGAEKAE